LMTYGKFIWKTLAITIIMLTLTASFNFLVDPLQFYRQAAFYRPSFSTEQRYQNPGLAKNFSYDTIIIGSSMTENFVPSYLNEKLGGNALKLSMSGASAYEENLIVQVALKTGQVENILWGLDYASLKGASDRVRNEDVPFPFYLYDQYSVNDLAYLLSITTLESSSIDLFNNIRNRPPANADLERLNNWSSWFSYDRDIMLKLWREDQAKRKAGIKQYDKTDGSFPAMQLSFNTNILPLIKNNPQVNFIIYYPPYSILRYRSIYEEDPAQFFSELQVKRYIFTCLEGSDNVILYDFQSDKNLITMLSHYKDFSHHSQAFNEFIIDSIARNDVRYRVTPWNLETMLSDLKEQVETLDTAKL